MDTAAKTRAKSKRTSQNTTGGHNAGYRAQIESLLGRSSDKRLADIWRQVYPIRLDPLPDRRGIIADLADFAVVLQPSLAGMRAPRLCWLIERYAGRKISRTDEGAVRRA